MKTNLCRPNPRTQYRAFNAVLADLTVRQYFHLIVDFDHDTIDGAPAARFMEELIGMIEQAAALQGMRTRCL